MTGILPSSSGFGADRRRAEVSGAMNLYDDRIFTRRLTLRKIEAEDLPLFVLWSNSREAYGNYLTPERLTDTEALEQLKSGLLWNNASRTYFIVLREGPPIGTMHFWFRPEKRRTAVVALKIALPAYRNQGFGTEAQKFLIMYLFERMEVECIELYTDIDNHAQQRCLQKLGFNIADTLTYEDQKVTRTGHLYRLQTHGFRSHPCYSYHYE
jgi:RimJ/RimL family protein N-acetyltransferase